jgi:hypothetical protein
MGLDLLEKDAGAKLAGTLKNLDFQGPTPAKGELAEVLPALSRLAQLGTAAQW